MRVIADRLEGVVSAVPSKSEAHRAFICAALADKHTHIECRGGSDDIDATVACLSALGAVIRRDQAGYDVNPINRAESGETVSLSCGESGSTFRFLLPIVGALGRNASFVLKGRLPERPLSPLYEELARHGCELSPQGSNPFYAAGQLVPGNYLLDGGVSSQFISGLLFALPLLDEDSKLRLEGNLESLPYIELTVKMLETFGINTAFDGGAFSIMGGQGYLSPGVVRIDGDWSNAAFWLGAGAIGEGRITCTGLDMKSRQGDRAIVEILSHFGARIECSDGAVSVSGGQLRGVEIDARDIPDLVPILAVIGAAAEGDTIIRNAGRLRTKESDRLAAMAELLRRLGADANETEDGLVLHGGAVLKGGTVSSCGDHRIAMAAA
ncbi:MAG: 3-phosphoshikimate 1-carboxyvinyltransferase, partial [Oscillospiraceae bacterium]|nr:3-phosphoshikimate 1-carboxyvinyltransferase [Oscillospiraceae bacterium]